MISAASASAVPPPQVTWLVIQCDDRPGLLAEVANVIARHQHNISVRLLLGWLAGWPVACVALLRGGLPQCCAPHLDPTMLALLPAAHHGLERSVLAWLYHILRGPRSVVKSHVSHSHREVCACVSSACVQAYSGFADSETGLFVMEYQLEGEGGGDGQRGREGRAGKGVVACFMSCFVVATSVWWEGRVLAGS